jgi:hypothetical protein
VSANKRLVLTMPAHRSFSIRARHKILVVVFASFCRSGRWHGRTSEALAHNLIAKMNRTNKANHRVRSSRRKRLNNMAILLNIVVSSFVFVGYGAPAQDACHYHYTVEDGDTLSELSAVHLGSSRLVRILQLLNHLQDADTIYSGMSLYIPQSPYCLVAPFVQPGVSESDMGSWKDLWMGTGDFETPEVTASIVSGNRLAVPVWNVGQGDRQFLLIELDGTEPPKLIFRSTDYRYDYGAYGLSSDSEWAWRFVDLDNDGETDMLAEHTEGTDLYATIYAFHWVDGHYQQYLYVDGIPLGWISAHRSPTGTLILDIHVRCEDCQARSTAPVLHIDWAVIQRQGAVTQHQNAER